MFSYVKIFGERRPQAFKRPESPSVLLRGLDDDLWGLLCKCWSDRPELRPTISEISPLIVKKTIVRKLNRMEEGFVIHSPANSASDEMRDFVLTIRSWLIDSDLPSILEFPDLERIFVIIIEKCPMQDLIKMMIHGKYSTIGHTRLVDLLHEVAIYLCKSFSVFVLTSVSADASA